MTFTPQSLPQLRENGSQKPNVLQNRGWRVFLAENTEQEMPQEV